jgi:hypothetical protein
MKAHLIPEGGFTQLNFYYNGTFCGEDGYSNLTYLMERYLTWGQTLNSSWSGLAYFTPYKAADPELHGCNSTWDADFIFVYMGNKTDQEFQDKVAALKGTVDSVSEVIDSFDNWYQRVNDSDIEYIFPYNLTKWYDSRQGGLPSVTVARERVANGDLLAYLKDRFLQCPQLLTSDACSTHHLYQCITGQLGSPQNDDTVSISPAYRTAMIHMLSSSIDEAHQ